MNIQIPILDEINTGMITVPGINYYAELDAAKFFYHKRRIFEIRTEPDNPVDRKAILFLYSGIPMGYMIGQHAIMYHKHISLWEQVKEFREDFKYYAIMDGQGEYGEYEFGTGTKKFKRFCYPIQIVTQKG